MRIRAGTSKWMADKFNYQVHYFTRKANHSVAKAKCGQLTADYALQKPATEDEVRFLLEEHCEECIGLVDESPSLRRTR